MNCWIVTAVLCIGAATAPAEKWSPAGPTTVIVELNARNVVLVDPVGRVSRDVEVEGEVPIPFCNRWGEGGTETVLDGPPDQPANSIVTMIEMERPIVGRYRLYAEVVDGGPAKARVNVVDLVGCSSLESVIKKGKGEYVWNIDFGADTTGSKCPVRLSKPSKSQRGKTP